MTATMLPKSTSNGQPRKQLADQIDRLDQILTGLSEGLDERINEAVQQAVVFAVRQAVQTTLTEVLTNPDLAARMQHSTPHVEKAAAARMLPAAARLRNLQRAPVVSPSRLILLANQTLKVRPQP